MKRDDNLSECCASAQSNPDCIHAVLHRSLCCRLGLVKPKDSARHEAYVLPMIFAYEHLQQDGGFNIYLHLEDPAADSGSLKMACIDYHLAKGIDVCVESDVAGPFIPSVGQVQGDRCYWTMAHASVVGYGKISKLSDSDKEDQGLKIRALGMLRRRYTGEDCPPMDPDDPSLGLVDVWTVFMPIDRITAKYHQVVFPSRRHA